MMQIYKIAIQVSYTSSAVFTYEHSDLLMKIFNSYICNIFKGSPSLLGNGINDIIIKTLKK